MRADVTEASSLFAFSTFAMGVCWLRFSRSFVVANLLFGRVQAGSLEVLQFPAGGFVLGRNGFVL